MTEAERLTLKTELIRLASRVKNHPNGRDGEQVKVSLEFLLKGQDAINYQVVKLFL